MACLCWTVTTSQIKNPGCQGKTAYQIYGKSDYRRIRKSAYLSREKVIDIYTACRPLVGGDAAERAQTYHQGTYHRADVPTDFTIVDGKLFFHHSSQSFFKIDVGIGALVPSCQTSTSEFSRFNSRTLSRSSRISLWIKFLPWSGLLKLVEYLLNNFTTDL